MAPPPPARTAMDEERYRLREFRPSDFPAAARIVSRLNPERTWTPEEMERWDRDLSVPPYVQVKIVAEERSREEAVGLGGLSTPPWSFDPRRFWVSVEVDPDHQGRGVGRALAAAVAAEAEQRQGLALWASARADRDRGVRFLARQGFEEKRRLWQSRLAVSTATELPNRTEDLAREGITFTTLAEEGPDRLEVRRRLHELIIAASADVPRIGPFTPISFEQFDQWSLRSPSLLWDAYFLATQAGRYIGLSNLTRIETDPTGLDQDFTGVLREMRGRGIARELKRRTVGYARQHGYRYIQTMNDSLNQPMWAINEKIGYRREVVWIQGQKELGTSPPRPGPG